MLMRSRGFTLVEILVVMVLLGTLLALVAPLAVNQLDRARAQSEWLALQRQVSRLTFEAFRRNDFLVMEADGGSLSWEWSSGERGAENYEQLFFPPVQRIQVNPNGVADTPRLEVVQRGTPRLIALNPGADS
jgi:prepilin-type N-terminal cleavage/methylation domain-containing protein